MAVMMGFRYKSRARPTSSSQAPQLGAWRTNALCFITGRGMRSAGGVPAVRLAVLRLLREWPVEIDERDPGVVRCQEKKGQNTGVFVVSGGGEFEELLGRFLF